MCHQCKHDREASGRHPGLSGGREPILESFLESSTQQPAPPLLKTRDFVEVGEMD